MSGSHGVVRRHRWWSRRGARDHRTARPRRRSRGRRARPGVPRLGRGPARVQAVVGSAADPAVAREAAARAGRAGTADRLGQQRGRLPGRRAGRPGRGPRPGPHQPRAGRRGSLRRRLEPSSPPGRRRVDRQRLLASGAAPGPGRAPLRHGQGRGRGPHPRGRGRPRAAGHQVQRGRPRLDHNRALPGVPGSRCRTRTRGRGPGTPPPPAGPDRTARGGGLRGRVPAPDEAAFVNGAVLPVDGGRAAYGPDPEET